MEFVEHGSKPVDRGSKSLLLVSALAQLAVGVLYLFAPILAPGGVVLVLWATWLALTITMLRWWRHGRGKLILLVPLASFLLWFGIIAAAQLVVGPFTA
jgi:hypothetical protein